MHPEELVIKHLAGETTEEEENFLNSWITSSEENQKLYNFHQSIWTGATPKNNIVDKNRIFHNIHSSIHSTPSKDSSLPTGKQVKISFFVRAASIIVFALLGTFIWYFIKNEKEELQVPIETRIIEKEVTKGQKLKTFLPDGSVVWLNAETRISYLEFFTDSVRLIQLNGMAYFDVAKDSLRPFVVRCTNFNVTALGTSFTVRSYDSENIVSVALERGSVAVDLHSENSYPDQITSFKIITD